MGQKKSVEKNTIVDEKFDEYVRMLKDIEGHYMAMVLSTAKLADKDWKATGNMKIGSTVDGEHWGEVEMEVSGFDVNSDSALATVMVALNNYINSPEFVVEMGSRMTKAMEGEAKLPEILAGK